MDRDDSTQLLGLIADRYGLRYLEKSRHYVGIYRGVGFDFSEQSNGISIRCFSSSASLSEQVLDDFSGFKNVRELGIPLSWLSGAMIAEKEIDSRACDLKLTSFHLKNVSEEQLMELPERLADDMQLFGASTVAEDCSHCQEKKADTLLSVDTWYQEICTDCLDKTTFQADNGVLVTETDIKWSTAISSLFAGTALFTVAWGGGQQLFPDGIPLLLLVGAPIFLAIMLAKYIARVADAYSVSLQWGTALCTLIATTLGNIWGYHMAGNRALKMAQQQGIIGFKGQAPFSLSESCHSYIVDFIPNQTEDAFYFFIGGLIGAWVGMKYFRVNSQSHVE